MDFKSNRRDRFADTDSKCSDSKPSLRESKQRFMLTECTQNLAARIKTAERCGQCIYANGNCSDKIKCTVRSAPQAYRKDNDHRFRPCWSVVPKCKPGRFKP